jgi:hypothetical protein
MFDALNSIDYVYRPYAVRVSVSGSPFREVAAAKAARDVMVAMFPSQSATFDAALAATTARFSGDAVTQGLSVGATAAQAILALRANDGWVRSGQVPYGNPTLPGYWQPVPPQNASATLFHYQDVLPFAIANRNQFLMEAPPALTSQRYADDFNEVKRLGAHGTANANGATLGGRGLRHSWAERVVQPRSRSRPGAISERRRHGARLCAAGDHDARRAADLVHGQVRLWAVASDDRDPRSGPG